MDDDDYDDYGDSSQLVEVVVRRNHETLRGKV